VCVFHLAINREHRKALRIIQATVANDWLALGAQKCVTVVNRCPFNIIV